MLAALLLPFASQAQNTLTVADGTATNSNVPIHGLYVDDFTRCQIIYPASEIEASALDYNMMGGTISSLTFYLSSPAAASWGDAYFEVKMMEVSATTLSGFVDVTNATTVYTGSLDGTSTPMTITLTTPYTYQGGNLLLEIGNTVEGTYKSASFYGVNTTGASWQGYNGSSFAAITGSAKNFMPKTTFTFTGGTEITCRPVTNLAIDATATTANSLTLTWTDALNTGATYSVYDMSDTTLIQANITDTIYTVAAGLDANTGYTFGVEANCSATDASSIMTVSGRTACAAISLPWICGFEADEIQSTTAATALPWCSNRYISPEATSGTNYPYSYTSNPHEGSRALYYFGTTSGSYPQVMAFILPEVDVNNYPMNANRISFWAKMGTASASKYVYVYTMTDRGDINTLTLVDSVLVSGNTHTKYTVALAGAPAIDANVALVVMKGTGALYLDDVTLEEVPSCPDMTGLEVAAVTSSSITLSWNSVAGATGYTVYDAEGELVASVSDTAYTINDLDGNTQYTFGVRANCTSGDGIIAPVSGRTACAAVTTLPYTVDFESDATGSMPDCWTKPVDAANIAVYAGNAHGGSNILRFYSGTGRYALMPEIEIPAAGISLTFWTRPESITNASCADFQVGYVTNAADMTTFVALETYHYNDWSAAEYEMKNLVATALPAGARIAFYHTGTTSWYWFLDDITVDVAPDCAPVSGLAASDITTDGATLTWMGNASSYYVYDMSDTSLVATVNDTAATLTNLSAMTTYTFGVTASCGSDESDIRTVTFRTACAAVTTLPYTADFENDATGSMPDCWTKPVDAANIAVYNGYAHGGSNSLRFFSGTGRYALMPEIEIPAAGISLTFWTRPESNTNASCADFQVGYVTNAADMTTFVALETYHYNDWSAAEYEMKNLVATGLPEGARIAFYHTGTANWYWFLDDVTVDEAPDCAPVSGLAANDITTDGATLTWMGNASSYYVYDMSDTSLVATVSDTAATLTNLSAMTTYIFGVAASCGSDESEMRTVTFSTACGAVDLPYTETFASTSGTRQCWNIVGEASNIGGVNGAGFVTINGRETMRFSSYSNASDYNQYGFSPVMNVSADATNLSVRVVYATYSADDKLYFGYVTATDTVWNPAEYTTSGSSDWQSQTFVIPTTATQLAVHYYGNYKFYAWIDSVEVTEMAAEYCYAVTNVTIDTVTSDGATISWTDDNNSGATYSIIGADGSVVATGLTATTYTFSGLTASTAYTFAVVTHCSADNSSDPTLVTFTTDCAGGSCTVKIYATDSYGDGWESSVLTISQNGATVATYNMADQGLYDTPIFDTFTVNVCSGIPVSFSWTSGSFYDEEAGFQILDGNDTVLYTVASASSLTSGAVFFTVADACGNNVPTPPALDSMQVTIAVNDVTMGTTIPAPGVHYFYEGDTASVIAVPNTGYQLTGWTFVMTLGGATYYDTTLNVPLTDFFDLFTDPWVVESGDHNITFNITANFAVGEAEPDTVTVNITVADLSEGTTNPAPGTHYFTNGDTASVVALPATGYTIAGWSVEVIDADGDTVIPQQVAPYEVDDVFDIFTSPIVANAMFDGYVFNVMPVFQADSTIITEPDSLILITAVNDPTMGTIIPAPGTHVLYAGDTFSVRAVPNDGYHVESWHVVMSYGPYTIRDTVMNLGLEEIFSLDTADYYFGMTMSFTANFAVGAAPEMHDSVIVITSVNDPTMGTITPAPGTHYYVEGDTVEFGIQPNPGYYIYAIQLTESHPFFGTQTETITDTAEIAEFLAEMEPVIVDTSLYGLVFEINVMFAAIGETPEEYTVSVNYNSTMGVVSVNGATVANGAEVTAMAGQSISFTANAYNNYEFVAWVDNGDTVGRQTMYTINNINADHSVTAVFVEKNAIADVDVDNVNIYSTDNVIVVRGAEGKNVVLFDVNGRMLSREANAAETVEFRVNNSGVYLVKVANAAAKRVVVIR